MAKLDFASREAGTMQTATLPLDTKSERLSLDVLQSHYQRVLLPQREHILVRPVLALRTQVHIEVVQDLGDDETHFVVCHASCVLAGISSERRDEALDGERGTYFLPKQSLEPTENGCSTALRSLANFSSPSQRSGAKDIGSLKLSGEVYIA